jgi:hypothetical protein
MLAATSTSSRVAAAAAGKTQRVSGSANQRTASTARVGGLPGPRIKATSTTDSENASTAKSGSRIWGSTWGSTTASQAWTGR